MSSDMCGSYLTRPMELKSRFSACLNTSELEKLSSIGSLSKNRREKGVNGYLTMS